MILSVSICETGKPNKTLVSFFFLRNRESGRYLEIGAEVVAVQVVEDFKCFSPWEDVAAYLLAVDRQEGGHPLDHLLLVGLHVQLEVSREPGKRSSGVT